MKNVILKKIVVSFAIALLASCNNEEPTTINPKSGLKISQIFNNSNDIEKKLLYSALSSDEKLLFWHNRLLSIIDNKFLNDNQKELLSQISSQLKSKAFEHQSAENIFFKSNIIPRLIEDLQQEFTNRQIGVIFS